MKAGTSHYPAPTSRQHPSQVRAGPLRLSFSVSLLRNIISLSHKFFLNLKAQSDPVHLAFNAIYINLKAGQTRYLFLLHTLQSVPNKVSSDCRVLPEANPETTAYIRKVRDDKQGLRPGWPVKDGICVVTILVMVLWIKEKNICCVLQK